jgi:hypothetical protein
MEKEFVGEFDLVLTSGMSVCLNNRPIRAIQSLNLNYLDKKGNLNFIMSENFMPNTFLTKGQLKITQKIKGNEIVLYDQVTVFSNLFITANANSVVAYLSLDFKKESI